MQIFTTFVLRLINRYTSYSFAVSSLSLGSGVLAYILAVSFSKAAGVSFSPALYERILLFVIVNGIIHGVFFGVFHRLGIPGLTKTIRLLNATIDKDMSISTQLSPHEYKRILSALVRLPLQNALISVILVSLLYFIIISRGSYDFEFMSMESFYLVGLTIFLIIFFIHGGFSFLFSEIATGYLRSQCKRIMLNKGILFQNRSTSSIRVKFYFFMGFIVLVIASSNALHFAYFINLTALAVYLLLSMVILYMGNRTILYMIFSSLKDINDAMVSAEKGKKAFLFSQSLDSEFLQLEDRIASTARKVSKFQNELERKVETRTRELLILNSALREKDVNMQLEMQFASDLQKGLVPPTDFRWENISISVYWEPMEIVTGDYYDIFLLDHDHLGVLSADVSGHGIPAALITAMAKISFSTAGQNSIHPNAIFREVNTQLSRIITTQDYLTAFYMTIDIKGKFLYGNASHPPARLYRRKTGKMEELDSGGMFIGSLIESNDLYESVENQLEPGDRVVLYTDGITEIANGESESFGLERLDEAIRRTSHLPTHHAVEGIMGEIRRFATSIRDDMTLMVLEYSPGENPPV